MAVALINSTSSKTGAPNTVVTSAISTEGADFLFVGFSTDDPSNPVLTDTYLNTWTALTSYTQTNVRVRTYYCQAPQVGPNHVFTGTVVAGATIIFALAFSGVKESGQVFDRESGANGFVATLQPGTLTPAQSNCLIVSILGINSAGAPMSIDSSFIETATEFEFAAGTNYGGSIAYLVQGAAAAVNPTWTRTNTNGTVCSQHVFFAQDADSQEVTSSAAAKTMTLSMTGAG